MFRLSTYVLTLGLLAAPAAAMTVGDTLTGDEVFGQVLPLVNAEGTATVGPGADLELVEFGNPPEFLLFLDFDFGPDRNQFALTSAVDFGVNEPTGFNQVILSNLDFETGFLLTDFQIIEDRLEDTIVTLSAGSLPNQVDIDISYSGRTDNPTPVNAGTPLFVGQYVTVNTINLIPTPSALALFLGALAVMGAVKARSGRVG